MAGSRDAVSCRLFSTASPATRPGIQRLLGDLYWGRRRRLGCRGEAGRAASLAGDDEAAFVGEDDQLDTVPGFQLCQDAGDVRFAGQRADEEALGNFAV